LYHPFGDELFEDFRDKDYANDDPIDVGNFVVDVWILGYSPYARNRDLFIGSRGVFFF
jgi:hypothetical protein